MALFPTSAIPAGSTGYDIDNSLRFNDDSNHYMERTPSSDGNRRTWTVSFWCKRGNLGHVVPNHQYIIFGANNNDARICFTEDDSHDGFRVVESQRFELITRGKKRDTAQWYHFVVQYDSTQGTSSNRIKIYQNGTRIPAGSPHWHIENYPSQNLESRLFTDDIVQQIGRSPQYTNRRWDGYLAEVHYVDGQALTSADFGEVDEDWGHWKPKKYTGSYGTNGFYLDFSNASSLGNDKAGSNNWTVYNLSTHDQVTDSPTNNWCTWQPTHLDRNESNHTWSEGSLKVVENGGGGYWRESFSTFEIPKTGKWYMEFYHVSGNAHIGITTGPGATVLDYNDVVKAGHAFWDYDATQGGEIYFKNSSGSTTVSQPGAQSNVVYAISVDAGTVKFWKSNSVVHTFTQKTTDYDPPVHAMVQMYSGATWVANFGQDHTFAGAKSGGSNAQDAEGYGSFYYTPPSGHKALCAKNLDDPAIKPEDHFHQHAYIQTGSTNNGTVQTVTTPASNGLVWIKNRSYSNANATFDILRGGSKLMNWAGTDADETVGGGITFGTTSYTIGNDSGGYGFNNRTGDKYIAHSWKANGSGSSNTSGTINSTVSANTAAGFSIVSYTGNGSSNQTIGHGLSSAPEFIMVRNTPSGHALRTAHRFFNQRSNPFHYQGLMNSSSGSNADTRSWQDTAPTSTKFYVGTDTDTNESGQPHIAYCWHSVEGYSRIGEYMGAGQDNGGAFVHCGFEPAFVLVKNISHSGNWAVQNRSDYLANNGVDMGTCGNHDSNQINPYLYWNSNSGNSTGHGFDFYSNGFKVRNYNNDWGNGGHHYFYMAFAKRPWKYSNAF